MSADPVSRTELRNFGLLVGSVALLLGGWWRVRDILPIPSWIALLFGAALLLFAFAAPSSLRLVHHYWMALGEAVSFVMTRVILLVVFFFVVTPIGLVRRLLGADPLRRRGPRASSYWEPYAVRQQNPKHYENMF
jgi:hypothetical protein